MTQAGKRRVSSSFSPSDHLANPYCDYLPDFVPGLPPGSLPDAKRPRTYSSDSVCPSSLMLSPVSLPETPSDDGDWDFIAWDPANPYKTHPREKVMRSEAEMEQQRKDVEALKESGGTCLCCYRAKKKCGTTSPCSSCSRRSHERICYRNWEALRLTSQSWQDSIPTREAADTLQQMCDEAFNGINQYHAVIEFRVPSSQRLFVFHWSSGRSEITFNPSYFTDDGFIDAFNDILPRVDYVKHEEQPESDPVAWDAIRMADLLMTAESLAEGMVHTSLPHVIPGRLHLYYILIHMFRRLGEMTEGFCRDLYEAMCGKDRRSTSPSDDEENTDPTWLAAALYLRIICRLKNLLRNPLVEKIFGSSSSSHFTEVCEKLHDFICHVPPRHGSLRKYDSLAIFDERVPPIPPAPVVHVSFCLSLDFLTFVMGQPERDAVFLSPAKHMTAFLADSFPRPVRSRRWNHERIAESSASGRVLTPYEQYVVNNREFLFELAHLSPVQPCENLRPEDMIALFDTKDPEN